MTLFEVVACSCWKCESIVFLLFIKSDMPNSLFKQVDAFKYLSCSSNKRCSCIGKFKQTSPILLFQTTNLYNSLCLLICWVWLCAKQISVGVGPECCCATYACKCFRMRGPCRGDCWVNVSFICYDTLVIFILFCLRIQRSVTTNFWISTCIQ